MSDPSVAKRLRDGSPKTSRTALVHGGRHGRLRRPMRMVATNAACFASGVALLGAAACGSQGGAGPYGGGVLGSDDFGFVGSGGGGSGYYRDSGTAADGGRRNGGLDGGLGSPVADGGNAGSSPGPDGGTSHGDDAGEEASPDGGSMVAVTFNLPPGLFASLDWVISGPSGYYSGTVYFGSAQSIEFVAGGIKAGSGYTITLAGDDRYGDPCSGTSAPFDVLAGQVSGSSVVLTCDVPLGDASQPADVTTGAVGVEAGVILHDL
jgi:hypothetical protein